MKKLLLSTSLIILPIYLAICQKTDIKVNPTAQKYAETITKADLKKHLSVIASDSMEGRDTGKPGQKKAAKYIAEQFANIGLLPPVKTQNGMSYLQEFAMVSRSWTEAYIRVGNQKMYFGKDFYILKNSLLTQETELKVILAGDASNQKWAELDLKDKAVVFIESNDDPKEIAGKAKSKGAKAVLFLKGKNQDEFDDALNFDAFYIKRPYRGLSSTKDEAIFYISPLSFCKILQIKEADFQTYQTKIGYTPSSSVFVKADKKESTDFTSENVLGFIEGTDKKDEIVVITAHYDHVGTKDGEVFNGADDDGSGTVSVMEIAEAFAKAKAEGKGPRRSMLFMTVSGEERGLYGSQFYTDFQPIFPLKNTVADLNIDMVGRIGGDYIAKNDPNYIYLIGSDKLSSELHELSEAVNKNYTNLKLDYKYNDENDPNRFYYRSDHYNFAKNNIPIIFYFNGVHEDYHQPTDEISKIHFPKMEKIARLIFFTAWEIANREQRIVVDKK
jgi:Peptidase family M28